MIIQLLKHQSEFLECQTKFALLLAGIGAGKSWAGCHFVINKLQTESSKVKGFIGANTYGQLTRATLSGLFLELNDLGIPFSYNQNRGILSIFGREIICGTMENYNAHRGIEIGWFWLDESRDMKKEAIQMLMGRLRDKNANKLEGRFTSSPNGFDWQHEYFYGELKTDEFQVIEARTRDNSFLPVGYEESLRANYDSKLALQELDGEIIDIKSGRACYAFKRKKHVVKDLEIIEDAPIWVSMDFNVNPMSAVLWNIVPYGQKGLLRAFDEIKIMGSNTYEFSDVLWSKLPNRQVPTIYPDPTGKRTTTNSRATVSDFTILKEKGFTDLRKKTKISVRDCLNALNNLFDKNQILVSSKCKNFIADLEQCIIKPGTNEIDKTDPDRTHWLDGAKYMADYEFPVKRRSRGISERRFR